MIRARLKSWTCAAFLLAGIGACTTSESPSSIGPDAGENVGTSTESIVHATRVPADALLSIVRVFTWRGVCTGTLIAPNRVLTAAHCICTENLVGGNVCQPAVSVEIRPNPRTNVAPPRITGVATYHPGYNPSWLDKEIENDLAVVAMVSDAPSYAVPMRLATTKPSVGTRVMIAGSGWTGADCDGPLGTLNYDIVTVDGLPDGGRMAQFNDPVACPGDSGGPIMDTAGTFIYAVESAGPPTVFHGWVDKAILVEPYLNWIRSLTCASDVENRCDARSPLCRCSAGVGDCDTDADCVSGLRCAQDVGSDFHYPWTVDVCVSPTPTGNGCPSGQFCCEPTSSGNCLVCRPSSAVCP